LEVRDINDLGIFKDANLSDPAVVANLSLSGSQDDFEDAAERLEKLDLGYVKSFQEEWEECEAKLREIEEKEKGSEETKKATERKEKADREREHQISQDMMYGKPWRKGGRWIDDGNFSRVGKMMRWDIDDDSLTQTLSADELDNPYRYEKMTYEEYEKDREERRYFPRRWARRLKLEKQKEDGLDDGLPSDNEDFQEGEKYDRYVEGERRDQEDLVDGDYRATPELPYLISDTRGSLTSISKSKSKSKLNLTRSERIIRAATSLLGLDEEKRRLARDRYQDERDVSRAAFDLEEDLLLHSNLSIGKIKEIREKARDSFQESLERIYREQETVTREQTLVANPSEALMPRRKGVNESWLHDMWVDLGDILVEMKLQDPVKAKKAFISLSYFVRKLYENPLDASARKIAVSSLHQSEGVLKFLGLIGFEKPVGEGRYLILPDEKADIFLIRTAMEHLEEALNNKHFGVWTATLRAIDKTKKDLGVDSEDVDWNTLQVPGFEDTFNETAGEKRNIVERLERITREKQEFGLIT